MWGYSSSVPVHVTPCGTAENHRAPATFPHDMQHTMQALPGHAPRVAPLLTSYGAHPAQTGIRSIQGPRSDLEGILPSAAYSAPLALHNYHTGASSSLNVFHNPHQPLLSHSDAPLSLAMYNRQLQERPNIDTLQPVHAMYSRPSATLPTCASPHLPHTHYARCLPSEPQPRHPSANAILCPTPNTRADDTVFHAEQDGQTTNSFRLSRQQTVSPAGGGEIVQVVEDLRKAQHRLRQSHAEVFRSLMELSRKIDSVIGLNAGRTDASLLNCAIAEHPILYMAYNMSALLKSSNKAFNRVDLCPVEDRTIEATGQDSDTINCTLREFQTIANLLSQGTGPVHVTCVPPLYDITFADAATVSELKIHFDSFAEICHILRVPLAQRVQALYREKKTARTGQIRAVQVVGCVWRSQCTSNKTSKIFLGCSTHSKVPRRKYFLLHDAPNWDGDGWNKGVTLESSAEACHGDLLEHEDSFSFCLTWSRLPSTPGSAPVSFSAGNVLGTLTASLPLVVIRGNELVESTIACLSDGAASRGVLAEICSPSSEEGTDSSLSGE